MTRGKPVLKYPGSKWLRAPWIIEHFPAYRTYVEPYFGSGGVFFSLETSPKYAVLNDKSGSVVNLFKVIRERCPELAAAIEMTPWSREEYDASYQPPTGNPLEDARRFLVRCWMAHGTRLNGKTGFRNRGSADGGMTYALWNQLPERLLAIVDRLKCAEIENRDALEIIERFADQDDCLLYVDPPYMLQTRSGALYEHEMNDSDHVQLLTMLEKHSGPVVLSGYAHALYDEMLKRWQRVEMSSLAEKGSVRTEVIWLNKKASRNQERQLTWEETA